MQSITLKLSPSGRGSYYLSPLGLSKDDISDKNLRAAATRKRNELNREYMTPKARYWHCDLSDRKRWMPNQLTKDAREKVLEGCDAILRKYGRYRTCFFTGTFPTRKRGHFAYLNKVWPQAMERWTRKLRYHLTSAGADNWWVYKVEFHQDGWPHVHAVYPAKAKGGKEWIIGPQLATKLWADSWVEQGYTPPFEDWKYSTKVEAVRKSASGYMAKYLSKAADMEVLEWPTSVKRFWGSSRPLKEHLKTCSLKESFEGSYPEYVALQESLVEVDGLQECSPSMATQSGGIWRGFTVSKESASLVVSQFEDFRLDGFPAEKLQRLSLTSSPSMHGIRKHRRNSDGRKSS